LNGAYSTSTLAQMVSEGVTFSISSRKPFVSTSTYAVGPLSSVNQIIEL